MWGSHERYIYIYIYIWSSSRESNPEYIWGEARISKDFQVISNEQPGLRAIKDLFIMITATEGIRSDLLEVVMLVNKKATIRMQVS